MTEINEILMAFAQDVRADRRANSNIAGDGTALELLIAPRFQKLIEEILRIRLPGAPRLLPEYKQAGLGRPALAFARPGGPARAFIELKEPAKQLNPERWRGHDVDQFRRFQELPIWALCNFHGIKLFRRGNVEDEAIILPAAALDPNTPDARADRMIRGHDANGFMAILEILAQAQPVPPRDAQELADSLAHAARLVRAIVADMCRANPPEALQAVQAEFRETLFAHPKAGGYDDEDETSLFANAFAQTLAFGLLLAREAGAQEVDERAYRSLPSGNFPLLSATLRALTQDEIIAALGASFDVLRDTVNVFDPAMLAPQDGRDPILYFYEDFLSVFDPAARKKHGVFFTPIPIVRFMVDATDRALQNHLGTEGIADRNVLLLDPACGTGTFLIAAATHGLARIRERYGEGAAATEMEALANRLHAFELLVIPYTVAHYRLLREVAAVTGKMPAGRLPIYLADTLAPPRDTRGLTPHLGFMAGPIVEERRAADTLKRETPIIAIIGNPPYRRLQAGEEAGIISGWDGGFWDDLKQPVRNAGWGNELNTFPELSVAFWRWCLWKIFESEGAPGRGVVCLITNRTFLAGHPYAGLRQMLRQRFDRLEILDLRGDSRGAQPAAVTQDEGVFNIMTGVCILTAMATNTERPQGALAEVFYADAWRHGAFTEAQKLAWVEQAKARPDTVSFVRIEGTGLTDFVPAGFQGFDWPSLPEVFQFRNSGVQTKRDSFVYANKTSDLMVRVAEFLAAQEADAKAIFHETRDRKASPAREVGWRPSFVREAMYRPFDLRMFYAHRAFVDFPRPDLAAAWGDTNRCLYAMPSGTGAGPAIWVHGLLPDYHAFRGSYGGYAFPLWDRRRGPATHNLNPALLAGLGAVYGRAVTPEAAFNAIIALLSASSYTTRFAWDLEEVFPHIPFPAEASVFEEAVRIGAEIAALQCFARAPAAGFSSAKLVGQATGRALKIPALGSAFLGQNDDFGSIPLLEDQSLRLAHVPKRVWDFAVSGYRVFYRWLKAREGEALADIQRDACDIAWRIEELLHWTDAADAVLEVALQRPLTKTGLDLAAPPAQPGDRLEF